MTADDWPLLSLYQSESHSSWNTSGIPFTCSACLPLDSGDRFLMGDLVGNLWEWSDTDGPQLLTSLYHNGPITHLVTQSPWILSLGNEGSASDTTALFKLWLFTEENHHVTCLGGPESPLSLPSLRSALECQLPLSLLSHEDPCDWLTTPISSVALASNLSLLVGLADKSILLLTWEFSENSSLGFWTKTSQYKSPLSPLSSSLTYRLCICDRFTSGVARGPLTSLFSLGQDKWLAVFLDAVSLFLPNSSTHEEPLTNISELYLSTGFGAPPQCTTRLHNDDLMVASPCSGSLGDDPYSSANSTIHSRIIRFSLSSSTTPSTTCFDLTGSVRSLNSLPGSSELVALLAPDHRSSNVSCLILLNLSSKCRVFQLDNLSLSTSIILFPLRRTLVRPLTRLNVLTADIRLTITEYSEDIRLRECLNKQQLEMARILLDLEEQLCLLNPRTKDNHVMNWKETLVRRRHTANLTRLRTRFALTLLRMPGKESEAIQQAVRALRFGGGVGGGDVSSLLFSIASLQSTSHRLFNALATFLESLLPSNAFPLLSLTKGKKDQYTRLLIACYALLPNGSQRLSERIGFWKSPVALQACQDGGFFKEALEMTQEYSIELLGEHLQLLLKQNPSKALGKLTHMIMAREGRERSGGGDGFSLLLPAWQKHLQLALAYPSGTGWETCGSLILAKEDSSKLSTKVTALCCRDSFSATTWACTWLCHIDTGLLRSRTDAFLSSQLPLESLFLRQLDLSRRGSRSPLATALQLHTSEAQASLSHTTALLYRSFNLLNGRLSSSDCCECRSAALTWIDTELTPQRGEFSPLLLLQMLCYRWKGKMIKEASPLAVDWMIGWLLREIQAKELLIRIFGPLQLKSCVLCSSQWLCWMKDSSFAANDKNLRYLFVQSALPFASSSSSPAISDWIQSSFSTCRVKDDCHSELFDLTRLVLTSELSIPWKWLNRIQHRQTLPTWMMNLTPSDDCVNPSVSNWPIIHHPSELTCLLCHCGEYQKDTMKPTDSSIQILLFGCGHSVHQPCLKNQTVKKQQGWKCPICSAKSMKRSLDRLAVEETEKVKRETIRQETRENQGNEQTFFGW